MSDKQLALFEARENLDYYIFCYDEFICLINNHDRFYHWAKDEYNISDVEYDKLLIGEVDVV